MSAAWPFVTVIVLYSALLFLRRPGKGGTVGQHIRRSDWLAWRDAMTEKENELNQLRKAEPPV